MSDKTPSASFTFDLGDCEEMLQKIRGGNFVESPRFCLKLQEGEAFETRLFCHLTLCPRVPQRADVADLALTVMRTEGFAPAATPVELWWSCEFFGRDTKTNAEKTLKYRTVQSKVMARDFVKHNLGFHRSAFDQTFKHCLRLGMTVEVDFGRLTPKLAFDPPKVDGDAKMLQARMAKMLESDEFSDTILVCEGKQFSAHKSVLAAASPVFAAMFANRDYAETKNGEVQIVDMAADELKAFLRLIYTNTFEDYENMIPALLVACDKYDVSDLRMKCEKHLIESISSKNAIEIFLLAKKLNGVSLKKAALAFIAQHIQELSQDPKLEELRKNDESCDVILLLEMLRV